MKITYHNTLRQIRLRHDHSAQILQDLHNKSIVLSRLESSTNIPDSAVKSFDIELVFQSDWDAMQRADSLAVGFEVLI